MRFFTPDLLVRFNATDDEVATRADQEWEDVSDRYLQHLSVIGPSLPSQARRLIDLGLHDAEILTINDPDAPPPVGRDEPSVASPRVADLWVRTRRELSVLIYGLSGPVVRLPAIVGWPFSPARLHWLYDEIDFAPDGEAGYVHRVLLSDGSLLAIPFLWAYIYQRSLETLGLANSDTTAESVTQVV